MRSALFLISVLFFGLNSFGQDKPLSGLSFSSHEVNQDQRTSLMLTPDGPFEFPGGFSMEAEANFRKGDGHYGYIFRIIGDGNTNIDLISNLASTSSNFELVLKDKVLFSYKWEDLTNGGFDKWMKVRIEIDPKKMRLAISLNGILQETTTDQIAGLKKFDIVFGACRKTSFHSTDVSPMSLRNIKIYDRGNNLIYNWKLEKHLHSKVLDEIVRAPGRAENPNWNIDKHVKWKKLRDLKLEHILGIAHDETGGRIFCVNNKAIYVFSTTSPRVDTIRFESGLPYTAMGKQIIYNKFTDELWSYSFYNNEISKFSFANKKWSFNGTPTAEPDFWHHNRFFSPIDSSLVTILGYGHYAYKSLINRYNTASKSWEQINVINQIQPRYLSGAGFLSNNEVLVFGGYGSKTGKQELSPEFYYDLYSLNLKNNTFKKLWSIESPSRSFVPCEALIADQRENSFYTLVYNKENFATSLHLAKFDIAGNGYQIFKDSIPYSFLDIKSWSTMFYDQQTSQLIAMTSHESEISFYSIAYPPLSPEDVYQSEPKKPNWLSSFIYFLFSLIIAGAVFLFTRKKKSSNRQEGLYVQVEHPNILPVGPVERKTISSVHLMGGFQMYDRFGHNITPAFSPTLKQLFVFIFLHTVKNNKGISSAKIDEVLWSDKMGDSARNNRNVNISKLRSILEEVEGVEVANENSFWKIKLLEPAYCDYVEILQFLSESRYKDLNDLQFNKLIALLSVGEFLPTMNFEWLDGFKSYFTNEIVDALSLLINKKELKSDFSRLYHLAECVLIYDPLNDEAFATKCSVLYHLGKKGMAKSLYDSFCREYKRVLGINYTISFSESIKN